MKKNRKQVKVGGIYRLRGGHKRETRLPRQWRRGGEYVSEKKEKIGVQRHIRIADSELNAQIERLMQQPVTKVQTRLSTTRSTTACQSLPRESSAVR